MNRKMEPLRGIYLVLDPSKERERLLVKLEECLQAGIDAVQLWNNWPGTMSLPDKLGLIKDILKIVAPFDLPVLINEEWQLLAKTELDGVHFDKIPRDFQHIQQEIGYDRIVGLTCGNDLSLVEWAEAHEIDYLSFCAMFPSRSVDDCAIVKPETVRDARSITQMPIFLSGGIIPRNLASLKELDFQGVAIISGIMDSPSIVKSVCAYRIALNQLKNQTS